MQGIYFINDRIELNGLTRDESFELQKQSLLDFVSKQDIQIITLNPYQLYNHYTILHALFYDLKTTNHQVDCFAFYSEEVLDDFIHTYPARWLLIKSYFNKCLPVCS